MTPIERLKKYIFEGNLWIYALSSLDEEKNLEKLLEIVFKQFGFLPPRSLFNRVIGKLARTGYLKSEKRMGVKYYQITDKGKQELGRAREILQNILQNI